MILFLVLSFLTFTAVFFAFLYGVDVGIKYHREVGDLDREDN